MKKSFIFGLSTVLFCLTSASFADTRYISDKIYVPLRVGDGSKYRIIHRGLPSGEKLDLISTNEDSGYSKVRTDKGVEGWLPSHYLTNSPAARSQLATNKKQIDELSSINKDLQKKLENTTQSSQETNSIVEELQLENKSLTEELEEIKRISANSIKLDDDNRRLLESNQMLSSEVDVLKTDNARLRENKENEFFLNGAFAVLIGVMIALIVPRMMPKRRSDWG
ncbi:TIGR04211 family SH3 domain-containing protein [Zhongshania aquimaris]|uniref:TIGR04211 family SH3 domain-containing protein n=1 Tax=Zhongshania aquimaris TaxID=2857107 RepID=A0ABS6VLY3_9GAMM|nr:TIGR04211 family SH3 domain-containing protein [Zhongshania aquimaris]